MLQKKISNQLITQKRIPILVSKNETSKYHTISLRLQIFPPLIKKSKLSPSDKNNETISDQASELSNLDTNRDKF